MSERCGIITFFSSQHAVRAEKLLKAAGYSVELVPGPKDISPNCGVAIKCLPADLPTAEALLAAGGVKYEAGHEYAPAGGKSLLDRLLGR